MLDEKLYTLVNKYNICTSGKDKQTRIREKNAAISYINDIFSDLGVCNIALYGAGEHTVNLLHSLSNENYSKVKFILGDKFNDRKMDKNKTYLYPEELMNIEVDVVVISSFASKSIIRDNIEKMGFNKTVIDLYDMFDAKGLHLDRAYYRVGKCEYRDIIEKHNLFNDEKEIKRKWELYEELIYMFIEIKDFISVFEYIDNYKKIREDYPEKYNDFATDLHEFFEWIKESIEKRDSKDIVINWVDALRYDEIDSMKYLKNIKENSLFFENAYTVIPTTTATMNTILTGVDDIFDLRNGFVDKFNSTNCIFLEKLEQLNYCFIYCGDKERANRFDDKYNLFSFNKECDIEQSISPFFQWECLNILLTEKKPCCIIIHNLPETHLPCVSPRLPYYKVWEKDEIKTEPHIDIAEKFEQINISRNYLDNQLEWYASFLSSKIVKIYLSDHGKLGKNMYDSDYIHVMYMVQGDSIKKEKCKDLFSLADSVNMLEYIIENKALEKRDYVRISNLPVYNKNYAELVMGFSQKDKYKLIQYKGIVTDKDKYIRYDYGKELYFLKDNNKNLINDIQCSSRIQELRDIMGDNFINVYKDQYYSASQIIYNSLNLKSLFTD